MLNEATNQSLFKKRFQVIPYIHLLNPALFDRYGIAEGEIFAEIAPVLVDNPLRLRFMTFIIGRRAIEDAVKAYM